MSDKKAEILAILKNVRPLPTELISQLEKSEDETDINAWITSLMGFTDEQLVRIYGLSGFAAYNALHRNEKIALRWTATGSIQVSLSTKRVRRTVYRIAFQHNAYFTGEKTSIFYDDTNLKFNLAFEDRKDARAFETALINATETERCPLEGLVVDLTISERRDPFHLKLTRRILPSDYKPEDSESSNDSISFAASSITMLDFKSDLVRYQRIELIEYMQNIYTSTEKCYLIDKAYCANFSSYEKFKNDENNCLSMSRDFHGWFDGLGVIVPSFKLNYISHNDQPMSNLDNRFEVVIAVTAINITASKLIFPRLQAGSKAVEGERLSMITKVYVRDPLVFKYCLEWKARKTSNIWEENLFEHNRD